MDSVDRELWLARRRAALQEVAAIEKQLGVEKAILYVPAPLHPTDAQQLAKHFTVIQGPRPAK